MYIHAYKAPLQIIASGRTIAFGKVCRSIDLPIIHLFLRSVRVGLWFVCVCVRALRFPLVNISGVDDTKSVRPAVSICKYICGRPLSSCSQAIRTASLTRHQGAKCPSGMILTGGRSQQWTAMDQMLSSRYLQMRKLVTKKKKDIC